MRARDCKALSIALGEPPAGFSLDLFGDFVNYRPPDGPPIGTCRALRIVGPGRSLIFFCHQGDPFASGWPRPPYELFYLDANDELVVFNPKRILQIYREETGHPGIGWDRAVGEWLKAHGARMFKGRGWAIECAKKMHGLIERWQSEGCTIEEA